LLTFGMFDAWIAAQEDPNALHELVEKLPKANSFVLSALIRLMKDISAYSDVTRMTSNNLAIVIAPNILYRRGDEMNISQGPATVVDTMICNYENIFRDVIKKEAANLEFTQEVERSCHDTLRKRASRLMASSNSPTSPAFDGKKQHHGGNIMGLFKTQGPTVTLSSSSGAKEKEHTSTLSSSVLSETVTQLLEAAKTSEPSTVPTR